MRECSDYIINQVEAEKKHLIPHNQLKLETG